MNVASSSPISCGEPRSLIFHGYACDPASTCTASTATASRGRARLCCATLRARRCPTTRTPATSTSRSSKALRSMSTAPIARLVSSLTHPAPATASAAPTAVSLWSSGRSPSSSVTADAGADAAPGWRARLELGFVPAGGGATALAHRRHTGPLAVQRPFFPQGPSVCHVYVLHPPGGIVGGDRLHLEAHVGGGAHALLTTPAPPKG